MKDIRRQLDQVVSKELARNIIPVKTEQGILVGNVLIVSEGTLKHLYKNGDCIYNNISLNAVAVKIANMLAKRQSQTHADKIYKADQEFSKWFVDSQILLQKHHAAINSKNYERADTLWAKYCESKSKAKAAKTTVMRLILF